MPIIQSKSGRVAINTDLAGDAFYHRLGEIVADPHNACAGRDDLLRVLAELSPNSMLHPPGQLALSVGAMVYSVVDQWAGLDDDTNEIVGQPGPPHGILVDHCLRELLDECDAKLTLTVYNIEAVIRWLASSCSWRRCVTATPTTKLISRQSR